MSAVQSTLVAVVTILFAHPLAWAETRQDRQAISEWFARFDKFAKKNDFDAMARMTVFPLQIVTTDEKSNGVSETWSRARFVEVMTLVAKAAPKDSQMDAQRKIFFLTNDLVNVVSKVNLTTPDGKRTEMRRADILARKGERWLLQTIAQGGFGVMVKRTAKVSPPDLRNDAEGFSVK